MAQIGPTFTDGMFAYDWDVCADDVPDGPVSVALDLRDEANNLNPNLPGLRHLSKNFTCPAPPPSCVPDDGQVAIFENPDYHGNCVLLDAGDYPNPIDLEA